MAIVSREPGSTGSHVDTAGHIVRRDDAGLDGRYPGGKGLSGLWQWIVGQMPPHAVYAEPFAGRAAIARRKAPAIRTWLVEQDSQVVAWLRKLHYPGAIVIHGDGIRWLERAAAELDEDALVYCDPPYMLDTRVKRRIYSRELTDREHEQLLDCLLSLRCQVMISGYWSQLYSTKLDGWSASSRSVITRGGTLRTEWLWSNSGLRSSPSSVAVEYSELGGDYRERERVARKVRRWQTNYLRMPAHEQSAILRGLVAVSGSNADDADGARGPTVPAMGPGYHTDAAADIGRNGGASSFRRKKDRGEA